ncbi:uncharacterized protein LOC113869254 [Abrus precatorius]|uniref:Uncharacterized protein LOC113869254 n=1 Tax=Abrus precatorius TaxID=3816 RepID=A0A8B8M274_ABRPR|nr:uncharacterized protein LOC113869254 [Abrus precatorius]
MVKYGSGTASTSTWVVVTKQPETSTKYKLERLTDLYVREIVRLQGVLTSVVFDRDPRITSRFWESLQRALGTKLKLSSTYHLQTDDMIQKQNEQIKMIREKMKAAHDRKKSYYDRRRNPLEFQVNDHVFLKVSIGHAVYQIALPLNLSNLHPVFHVSQLRKYVLDPSHVIELDPVQVREDLSYDVYLVRIADHRVKQLRGKEISLVKVIWSSSDEGNVI